MRRTHKRMTKIPELHAQRNSLLSNERIELLSIDDLKFFERRLRKTPEWKLDNLARSLGAFGFVIPILIDAASRIICGEARVAAARQLGLRTVPCIRVTHLSSAQVRAFRIADNRLAQDSEWDRVELGNEIKEIILDEPGFDTDLLGFQVPELDLILNPEPVGEAGDPADDDGIVPQADAVSRLGDEWHLGPHRLRCGDATVPATIARLLGGDKAPLYVGDPPYGISTRKIGSKGRIKHREFVQGSGEQTPDEFFEFLRSSIEAAVSGLAPGALAYWWCDWRQLHTTVNAGLACGLSLVNICCWCKTSPGMGSFYRSQMELCVVFRLPGGPPINNIQLGRFGRNRSNVWFAPGMNGFSRDRMELLKLHPTVKPCQLIEGILKDASRRGDIIVDTFCGSGTALIAAHKTGRIARCLELDPLYVDVAIRRFQKRFGIEAVHAVTGRTFAEEAAFRLAEAIAAASVPTRPRPVRKPPALPRALASRT